MLGYLARKESLQAEPLDRRDFGLLLLIWGASLTLRMLGLRSLYLWIDENLIISNVLQAHTMEYWDVLTQGPKTTTYNSLTFVVPLFMAKTFHGSLFAARFPSALLGSLMAPAVYYLARISGTSRKGAFIAASFAAGSLVQIECAQRMYPLGVSSALSAVLIGCALLMIRDMVTEKQMPMRKRWGIMTLFAVTSLMGMGYHFSILMVALPCVGLLMFFSLKHWHRPGAMMPILLGVIPVILGAAFAVLFSLGEANRFYLKDYYCPLPLDFSALTFFGEGIYRMLVFWTNLLALQMGRWPVSAEMLLGWAGADIPPVLEQRFPIANLLFVLSHVPFILGLVGFFHSILRPKTLEKILLVIMFLTILVEVCLGSIMKVYPLGPLRHSLPAAALWYVMIGWGWDFIANTRKVLMWLTAALLSLLAFFWTFTLWSGFYARTDALEIADLPSLVRSYKPDVVWIDWWSAKDISYYWQKKTGAAPPACRTLHKDPHSATHTTLAIPEDYYNDPLERGLLIIGEGFYSKNRGLLADLESRGYTVQQVFRQEPENVYVADDSMNGVEIYYFYTTRRGSISSCRRRAGSGPLLHYLEKEGYLRRS